MDKIKQADKIYSSLEKKSQRGPGSSGTPGKPKSNVERVMNHFDVSEEEAEKMLEEKSVDELLPNRGQAIREDLSDKKSQRKKESVEKNEDLNTYKVEAVFRFDTDYNNIDNSMPNGDENHVTNIIEHLNDSGKQSGEYIKVRKIELLD